MPVISRFFGILIRMYYRDHEPAHFHAAYGEQEALIAVETLMVLRGGLPRRATAMVLEWAVMHRDELQENWDLARAGEAVQPIEPLE